tara:strand:- start:125 stop:493 length:369 start_codon:yes stop_codon:yes gene_type:complete
MLPEEANAAMLYIAWDLAHKAEKESAEQMRAHTDRAWKAREEAEKEAEEARWRQKVTVGTDIAPEELKALEEAVKAAEKNHELATNAEDDTRMALYDCEDKLREAIEFVAARKELAAQEKPE